MSQFDTATLAGGCFWCTEAVFNRLKGVTSVVPGYAASKVANPSYEAVCSGRTGAAEAIQITYDPSVISYDKLLDIFWHLHDPTTLNRQGHDIGTQYRSAIFYHSPEQKAAAEALIRELTQARRWPNPIVTEVAPFTVFYKAEPYHQEYFAHNPYVPYCQAVVGPKVAKFRKQYRERLKQTAAR